LSKIPKNFRDFRELLHFQELRFREFRILNRENQVLKIDKISGEHNE